jgi:hypothetical protein
MKDGTVVKESEEIHFGMLDMEDVEKFRITESGGSIAVPFSSDSGIIRFTNLDLQQIQALDDKAQLTFIFDKKNGFFKLDKESLQLYDTIMLKDKTAYYFIEFDQSGIFNVNGEILFAGFEYEGQAIEFKEQPPYNSIIQYANGLSEIRMRGSKPINKNEKTLNYVIGYTKEHKHKDLTFNLKYEIVYDLMNRCVMLDLIICCNKGISGKIFLSYGGKVSSIPVKLTENSPMQTKRVLSVIG